MKKVHGFKVEAPKSVPVPDVIHRLSRLRFLSQTLVAGGVPCGKDTP